MPLARSSLAVALIAILSAAVGMHSTARAEMIVIPPPLRKLIPMDQALKRWSLTAEELSTLGPNDFQRRMDVKGQREAIESAAETDPVAALALGLSMIPQDASLGLEPNVMEAFHWISVAAQSGHPRAVATLAMIYSTGYGVPKNEKEATRLHRIAAEQGAVTSMFNLSVAYAFGYGVPVDQAEALKWARAAAAKGHARAMYNVGYAYFDGKGGVQQDYAEALNWFRKGAEGGAPKAMAMIGYMYQKGLGVPADDTEAFKWYQKAADKGDKASRALIMSRSENDATPASNGQSK
jgi:TPR repeat protein